MSFVKKFNRLPIFASRFFSKKVNSEIVSMEDIKYTIGNVYQENLSYDHVPGMNVKFNILKDEERKEIDRLAEVSLEHAKRN